MEQKGSSFPPLHQDRPIDSHRSAHRRLDGTVGLSAFIFARDVGLGREEALLRIAACFTRAERSYWMMVSFNELEFCTEIKPASVLAIFVKAWA